MNNVPVHRFSVFIVNFEQVFATVSWGGIKALIYRRNKWSQYKLGNDNSAKQIIAVLLVIRMQTNRVPVNIT